MGRESENAALINDIISKGQIVPVAITIALIKAAMQENGWEVVKFDQENKVSDRWIP